MADYDVAIVGGGLTGASIARDAAGRGLRVVLFEQGDLARGASSATSRLITGDLGRLEQRAFAGVRAALVERERALRLAPHLVQPARFVLPLHPEGRPAWLLQLGLSLYTKLAPGPVAPVAALDLSHHEIGFCLQRPFGAAFEFSDAVADDSRLVILNAVDAAARGADICVGARCVRADRESDWRLAVIDRGRRRIVTARALVSAVGAWTGQFLETVLRVAAPPLALVRETQILVRKLYDHDRVYVLQHRGGELVFVQPYAADLSLIGTARSPFQGDLAAVAPAAREVAELCSAANRFFREQLSPGDVIGTICGVRAQPAGGSDGRRDGVVTIDRKFREPPLAVTFGGDITSYRRRAQTVVDALAVFYANAAPWTADTPLVGGDFVDREAQILKTRTQYPFLSAAEAERLTRSYGTRVAAVLGAARTADDLGPRFGEALTAAEVRYLMRQEWARTPDDIVSRRSKSGLSLAPAARDALAQFMKSVT
jgi:glycerol-3-phosphate dehydrogenase